MTARQKITPSLWFNFNAEEAVHHYLGIFRRSKVLEVSHYCEESPELAGKVLVMRFEIEGQQFQALNGGPQVSFNHDANHDVDGQARHRPVAAGIRRSVVQSTVKRTQHERIKNHYFHRRPGPGPDTPD
jgi:hypothetical protein